jgi:antitoxin Phd
MTWKLEEAKARFDEVYESSLREGAQVIEREGGEAAVLVPMGEWKRMQGERPSLKQLLLSAEPRIDDMMIPEHGSSHLSGSVRMGRRTAKEVMLSPTPVCDDMMIPERGHLTRREIVEFE